MYTIYTHSRASHGSGLSIYDALDMEHLLICLNDCCVGVGKPV